MNLRKILIVDDDDSSLYVLNDILVKMGFTNIIKTSDAHECMNIYNENNDIDLIFVDLKMPKTSGYDVIKNIRSVNEKIIPKILKRYLYYLEQMNI